MNEKTHTRKSKSITLTTKQAILGILIIILVLPDEIFGLTTIYSSSTPSFIKSIRLNYRFDLIQLGILLLGIRCYLKKNDKSFFVLYALLFAREMVISFVSPKSIFATSSYEMYLVMAVGYYLYISVESNLDTLEELETFFSIYIILNILTIYFNLVMHEFDLARRYNASNLDVGGTGSICSIGVLLFFFKYIRTTKVLHLVSMLISLIGLVLSGSRTNIGFASGIIAAYFIISTYYIIKRHEANVSDITIRIAVVLVLIFLALLFSIDMSSNAMLSNIFRVSSITTADFLKDESFKGRFQSLTTGFDIIRAHPLGISGYFINLQYEMQTRGYPTFPHSTLISYYILFGPFVFFFYYKIIQAIKRIKSIENPFKWISLYLFISTVIYGGPITNFKVFFQLFIILGITEIYDAAEIDDIDEILKAIVED